MNPIDSLRKARAAYELGRRLQTKIERGRKLHPWESRRGALAALEAEVLELRKAVAVETEQRISDEADDVCVVALRIAAGC